ncbi:MAG TPA: hypothetical protein VKA39_02050 [Beijerinckiaceae bacterium]|nr:hypothetical protein [Beijerinckiaceae bacterium]
MPRGERSIVIEDLQPTRRIEENNAASGGHRDDPIPERPNSRMAKGDVKRAAAKAVGVMGLSKKHDPDLKMTAAKSPARSDGVKKSAGARSADKALDKGSARAPAEGAPVRVRRSNAEISEGLTATARRSPAPRSAEAASDASPTPNAQNKRTGGARQRVPAPGNAVTVPKGQLINPKRSAGGRSTSSSGGAKPPKKSAQAGKPSPNVRSRGADQGIAE